jgi:Effector Associated Constant Component 1
MPILLSISAADLDDESLQELTRQLCQDLRDEAGIESSLVAQSAKSGTKGDLVTIGQILVAAIGAGGPIVALVNLLKAYVIRKPSLQIKVRKKNGDTMEIKADDLRSNDMTKLVQAVKEAFEEV